MAGGSAAWSRSSQESRLGRRGCPARRRLRDPAAYGVTKAELAAAGFPI